MFKSKGLAESIISNFDKKYPREKSDKMSFKEAPVQALADGGDVLTANARKHIAPHNFALPGGRYPIHDETHARNALARVSQHGTPEEKAEVRRKVKAKYPGIEQSHADGGEVEDDDHMEALSAHSEAMHAAREAGDHKAHARALNAFLDERDLHSKKKDVDYGNPSDEKDAPNKIAGDEYD